MTTRRWFVPALIGVSISLLAGCGDDVDDLTLEQQLEKLAGRELTSSEVAKQVELADLLCGFDNRVLGEIWGRLDARQLEFQDYVFGQHCNDRISVYSDARPSTGTVPTDLLTTSTTATSTEPRRSAPNAPVADRSATTGDSSGSTTTSASTTTATSLGADG